MSVLQDFHWHRLKVRGIRGHLMATAVVIQSQSYNRKGQVFISPCGMHRSSSPHIVELCVLVYYYNNTVKWSQCYDTVIFSQSYLLFWNVWKLHASFDANHSWNHSSESFNQTNLVDLDLIDTQSSTNSALWHRKSTKIVHFPWLDNVIKRLACDWL